MSNTGYYINNIFISDVAAKKTTGTAFMKIKLLVGLIIVFSCALQLHAQPVDGDPCSITASDLDSASMIVTRLHGTLITVMQDAENLGYQGRYDVLAPVVSENFNTPLITRTILGSRYWDSLAEQQQNEFIDLFLQLSIATYADRFDSYGEEKFVELERKSLPLRGKCPPPEGKEPPAQRIIVKTELQKVKDDPVKLEYLLQKIDSKWYIITVIADGVNDLSLKRGEYSDVIKNKGFDGLVEEIKNKIRDMEKDTDS